MDQHQAAQQPAQYYALPDAQQEKTGQFQYQQAYELQQHHNTNSPASGPTMLSVTRGVALSVVGVIVFLLVTVIGLSAGLGVSQRDLQQVKGDLEAAQAVLSVTSAPTTAVVLPTSTTASIPAVASPTAKADVQCPRVNGTIYTASSGGKRFRRLCGVDYGGEGEAVDIGNVKTINLDACIDACASETNCTGAGWGVIEGDKGPTHSCWMKTNLTKSHKANA
ncbi:hypothetical protein CHGG_09569 [Chaetomium globosum CBS 148.51]|uniref:Apple domain-containing protein n=1 Tax=Chaetomium globosum (strain ATCC 6205 / CBS 148.51 / DSM 1962 / NBRC 6347 / NRRL 1970) TaxID=306901 RepID=Q2GR35_CHAGB|nr:uncharacterized protein CHGG_09569 [Chaetomium globosum CBS 148.51]EAQ85555.1 hypothetical protein CHGG_09569 [Chaetomium globosum CBS 148.51]